MCTSIIFQNPDRVLLANNEDVFLATGMVFTNRRGQRKTALLRPPETPLSWTSRWGSLVFSQCGKEFPSGGMNEAGLAIEQMTLRETRYPAPDPRPALNELQVIQYLLDTCASVAEALERILAVRIAQASASLHYLLCDRSGTRALVEFLNGEAQVRSGPAFPLPVVTNSPYPASLASLESPARPAGMIWDDYARDSLDRFRRAAACLAEGPADASRWVESAFASLDRCARPDTQWRIVYDLTGGSIHLSTRWDPAVKTLDLRRLDFSTSAPARAWDLAWPASGSLNERLVDYSPALNRKLVDSFFKNPLIVQAFGFQLPEELLAAFASYPDQF